MFHHHSLWVHCRIQPSLLIPIPGYSSKSSNLTSPSSSLSNLPSFIIPGLPFCYSNFHLLSLHHMTCPANFHFFINWIVFIMCSALVCSLIHDYLLLPFELHTDVVVRHASDECRLLEPRCNTDMGFRPIRNSVPTLYYWLPTFVNAIIKVDL